MNWKRKKRRLPEKAYKAIATRSRIVTRGTPNWPFGRPTLYRVNLEFSPPFEPVPVPGKGENSWDCGENATYGMSCAADTIEEAIGKFVSSTLRTRTRYGGQNWTPKQKAAAAE